MVPEPQQIVLLLTQQRSHYAYLLSTTNISNSTSLPGHDAQIRYFTTSHACLDPKVRHESNGYYLLTVSRRWDKPALEHDMVISSIQPSVARKPRTNNVMRAQASYMQVSNLLARRCTTTLHHHQQLLSSLAVPSHRRDAGLGS